MIGSDTRLVGIDTNVILRAVLDDDPIQSPVAKRLFRDLTGETPGFITQVSLVETYWVLARSVRMPRAACLTVIRALVGTEVLEFDDGESVVRALTLAEDGADFADALIEGTMELFGVAETVTFDRAAAGRLGWQVLGDTGSA
ncbi:type II toxin-antitoxin system VapC family toxin [Agromyces sp. H66]|uniref:PIN domain-containing protein n=1 Tax=Agromyces sp. H66 TaxID=2529859 RepID=UPI001B7D8BBD|nr:type II toxin-antitoxin system VapC family toxin [Agromyces sp. H66]